MSKVLVEVMGGVAYICTDDFDLEIIHVDWDNIAGEQLYGEEDEDFMLRLKNKEEEIALLRKKLQEQYERQRNDRMTML